MPISCILWFVVRIDETPCKLANSVYGGCNFWPNSGGGLIDGPQTDWVVYGKLKL